MAPTDVQVAALIFATAPDFLNPTPVAVRISPTRHRFLPVHVSGHDQTSSVGRVGALVGRLRAQPTVDYERITSDRAFCN